MNSQTEPSVKEVVMAAKEIIKNPDHWCQYSLARDAAGCSTTPLDPDAICFCSSGAIMKVCGDHEGLFVKVINDISPHLGPWALPQYNDQHSHDEVLNLLDIIINKLP